MREVSGCYPVRLLVGLFLIYLRVHARRQPASQTDEQTRPRTNRTPGSKVKNKSKICHSIGTKKFTDQDYYTERLLRQQGILQRKVNNINKSKKFTDQDYYTERLLRQQGIL